MENISDSFLRNFLWKLETAWNSPVKYYASKYRRFLFGTLLGFSSYELICIGTYWMRKVFLLVASFSDLNGNCIHPINGIAPKRKTEKFMPRKFIFEVWVHFVKFCWEAKRDWNLFLSVEISLVNQKLPFRIRNSVWNYLL